MPKLFHLYIKSTGKDHYYGSLSGLFKNHNIGISKFTLDRYDFSEPYENDLCVLKKGVFEKDKRAPKTYHVITFSHTDG